jgi:2-phospho-L-lactate/phosphoenolpyruvate guanylyltransferase
MAQPVTDQGTVSEFDPASRTGVVLLDDGTAVPFPAEAFAVSGLRLLRPGQRVRIDRDAHGGVTRVTLFTLA